MENYTSTSSLPEVLQITFSWYDYTLFTAMLGMSALIGVYFGFFKKQESAEDYLLGGKEMSVIPIAVSLVASAISGITLLAVPADIYRFGITYWFCAPMMIVVALISYLIFVPVFYKLQITSTYEYFNIRFDKKIRTFSSVLFTLSIFLYLPVVIYIPALALAQATGINAHLITPIVCGVCIFYTTLGGLKAVVWTDTLQFVVMIGAIIVVFVMGIIDTGGFGVIWEKSIEGKRLDVDFDFDLTKRDTVWTGTLATTFMWLSYVGIGQGFVQKCIALPTYKDVRTAFILFSIGMFTVVSASVFTGLIMFARYFDCDPLVSGVVKRPDQLLPYYVMDVAKSLPGLPGLFIAGIFSAALSTLSAVMNCLAGTFYEDFLSQHMPKGITQKRVSDVLKILVVTIGVICTGLVFVIEQLGSLLPLAFSLGGCTAGPLLGLFSVGMLVPMVNAKGALYGGISSLVVMCWIVTGSQYYQMKKLINFPTLPSFTEGCDSSLNLTHAYHNESTFDDPGHDEPLYIYRVSYYYYALMGMLLVFIVSIPVSWWTRDKNAKVNRDCFSPIIHFLLPDEKSDPPAYYSIEKALHIVVPHEKEVL